MAGLDPAMHENTELSA